MKFVGSSSIGAVSVVTIDPKLLSLKDIVLRQRSLVIQVEDAEFLELCNKLALEMFEVMYATDGAATAAPSVGIPLRLVVMDPASLDFGPHVLINPAITSRTEKEEIGAEGCLSLPGYMGRIPSTTLLDHFWTEQRN